MPTVKKPFQLVYGEITDLSNCKLISTYIINAGNIFDTFVLDVPDTQFSGSGNKCLFLKFKDMKFNSFKNIKNENNKLFPRTNGVEITSKAQRLCFNFYISTPCQLKGNLKHFRNYTLSSVISSYNYDKLFFNCTNITDIRRFKHGC